MKVIFHGGIFKCLNVCHVRSPVGSFFYSLEGAPHASRLGHILFAIESNQKPLGEIIQQMFLGSFLNKVP